MQRQPEITEKEAQETLALFTTSMLPLARAYSKTPLLAQWYLSIPMRVAGTYSRLRRGKRMLMANFAGESMKKHYAFKNLQAVSVQEKWSVIMMSILMRTLMDYHIIIAIRC